MLRPSRWDVCTPNQVPVLPFKPGFPSDFAISVSSTWILPRIDPEIHSWGLPWLAPPPSPLVWTLKQLLPVSTTWQFILYGLINIAPVKRLKGTCIYSLSSQRLETSYEKGLGLSLCWIPHKADLQKLQRYLFINSVNRHLVSLHSEQTQHPPQALGSLGLSLSLHSIKGRAGGSPKNSASAVLIYIPFKMNKKLRFISPQKEAYWEAPHLPLPPKETSEKRNIRC